MNIQCTNQCKCRLDSAEQGRQSSKGAADLSEQIDCQDFTLVPQQGVNVGAVVQAPQLDRAIKGAAEQLVGALAEGEPRHNVPVAWEALCAQQRAP